MGQKKLGIRNAPRLARIALTASVALTFAAGCYPSNYSWHPAHSNDAGWAQRTEPAPYEQASGRAPAMPDRMENDPTRSEPHRPFDETLAASQPPGFEKVAGRGAMGQTGGESAVTGGTPEEPVEDWLAQEGMTLRAILQDWGDRAGWRIVWASEREYLLEAGAMFRGRYEDVSAALIRAFARARPAPYATFYHGNRVLLVMTQEEENAD